MKYFLIIFSLFLSGCGGHEKNILLTTGKVPPAYFQMTDKKTMDNFIFDTKKFSFKFPTSKEKDFIENKRWYGVSMRDGNTISFGMGPYNIDITTPYLSREYTEMDRAIHRGDVKYVRNRIKIDNSDKLYIELHGKERYTCTVMEYTKRKYKNSRYVSYECYKFGKNKVKKVHIRFTYSKPTNPTLAKHYTYADLKRRAKRMLDSLYIKDGW